MEHGQQHEGSDKTRDGNQSGSDEEFFDCDETREESPKPKTDLPIWSRKPEGRANKLGKHKLLEHDDWLYVPICQDPAPLTEDQLAEQAEVRYPSYSM